MRLGAKTIFWLIGAVCAISAAIALVALPICAAHNVKYFFEDHLREPLFVGLLTVAAFLFSLKTFIIVTMEDRVYGTKEYGKEWELKRVMNTSLRRYAPLENFAELLFLSVLMSLIAAVIQFTLGLFTTAFAAVVSIAFAVWSLAMIFVSLFYLQQNLKSWFKFLNNASK